MAQAEFDELVETFEFLDDWESRYTHVIDMGKALPPLDDALKSPATKVDGCASQVWLYPRIDRDVTPPVLHFDGDSDAIIVKGLIAVLQTLYNGRTLPDVAGVDAAAAFGQLGLDEHLSSQRSNGVRAMVERLRGLAAAGYSAANIPGNSP